MMALLSILLAAPVARGQQASEAAEVSADPTPLRKDPSSHQQTQFAPGIVTVIPPAPHPQETSDGPHTLPQLLDMHPEIKLGSDTHPGGEPHFDPRARTLHEMAKQIFLYREVYCLEFSFKPLRHFYVDVPRPDGRRQRKLIWYMAYRVRYRGQDLRPVPKKIGDGDVHERVEAIHYDARYFFPMLRLVDHTSGKEYIDRILPAVIPKIKVREKITTELHNSVEMGSVKVPYSSDPDAPGVWGVATWEDVDPNADFVSVEVFGLTNAFEQEGVGPDAPYRRKALKLYFYRPGDTIDQTDDRIRFGIPAFEDEQEQSYILQQYGLQERVDYRWIFK